MQTLFAPLFLCVQPVLPRGAADGKRRGAQINRRQAKVRTNAQIKTHRTKKQNAPPAGQKAPRPSLKNTVRTQSWFGQKGAPCRACYYCREHGGTCVYQDDMAEILQAMIDADVLVLASPVYFYSFDAQLKAVIDRTVARWLEVQNKEFYYIMAAADEERSAMDATLASLRGYAACVNGAKEMGVIYGTGVYEKGKLLSTPAMAEAYEMGKNV